MVYVSDTFGAAPVLVASRITSIGFASHHSPDHHHPLHYTIDSGTKTFIPIYIKCNNKNDEKASIISSKMLVCSFMFYSEPRQLITCQLEAF